jgi:hypothetical protein
MGFIQNSLSHANDSNTAFVTAMLCLNALCIIHSCILHRSKVFAARVVADLCAFIAVVALVIELLTIYLRGLQTLTWSVVLHNVVQVGICVPAIGALDAYVSYERWYGFSSVA